ncbi:MULTISPECIES: hypothetical protein [Enterococcus]|uniref:Uncharacterized protein n=2 Tax=Enterococcus gallinarum TaxID=1353 RepID=A0ABD4ZXK9_ENTGA|nr:MULTISPECIES: hypothetical protein [Enterococcus]MBF0825266.1 hypothetical protein [Enterococcus faecalis]MBF0798911.1 hypothetical protein [Enterococcus gallinarum]MBX8979367.1 hypothetical protein [Enterococcus gallinarum]MCO5478020.1 hypothetical protein [Enterococcus gallinarum]MCR1929507.1 hypothetical protein [Enterococcus gallinarum]
MDVNKIVKLLIPISIYEVFVVIFLIKLNELNAYLLKEYSNAFFMELLQYNGWEPLEYFGMTVVLGAIGIIGIVFCWNILKNSYVDVEEMLACILSIFFFVVTIILLVKFISIPILKAVFLATIALVGGAYSFSKK